MVKKNSKKTAVLRKSITWSSKRVKAKDINPTPNNYKIKSDLGRERLQTSLSKFGRAGTVVVNPALKSGKYDLIDGNSRWQEVMDRNPNEVMEVSIPNRKLTSTEYKEMSAMFDFAKAGEVDEQRIMGDLGTSKDFYEKWGLEIPMEILEKMGKKANMVDLEYPEEGKGNKKAKKGETPEVSGMRLVQAFFTDQQEMEFRKLEEKFSKKMGTDNTTDFIFQCVKFATKNKK